MRRELTITGLLAAGVYVWGCQPGADPTVTKKLDDITAKLDAIEKKIGTGAPQRPQPPPGPDPTTVYAVPIEGAAFKGPEHAKVTIVEAFEFA
jgi:hypothetical protein